MGSESNGHGSGGWLIRTSGQVGDGSEHVAAVAGVRSGRMFVLALAFVLGALTLALFVAFRQWKSRHSELASYGRTHVAAVVMPLARRVPSGISADEWGRVIDALRSVLEGLTASGLLDIEQMRKLRKDLTLAVDEAGPENSATTVAKLWATLEQQAGPALTGSPRFELASAIRALPNPEPPGDLERWALAIVRTRAMLTALAADPTLSRDDRRALRELLEAKVRDAKPEPAWQVLLEVWELTEEGRRLPPGLSRPEAPR